MIVNWGGENKKQIMVSKDKNKIPDKNKLENKKKKVSKKRSIKQNNTEIERELKESESNINISEKDIFAGNEDFYKILEDSSKENKSHSQKSNKKNLSKKSHIRSLSLLQKILIAGIMIISFFIITAILVTKKGLENESDIIAANNIEDINTNYIKSPTYEKSNKLAETAEDKNNTLV